MANEIKSVKEIVLNAIKKYHTKLKTIMLQRSDLGIANGAASLDENAKIPKEQIPDITKTDVGLGNVPNVTTNNQKPTFSQATTRENLVSGETLSTSLGKIMKFFADLKAVAFSGAYSDVTGKPTIVNNGTTTATNTVLDGRMGKTLTDKIATLNSALTNVKITAKSESLTFTAISGENLSYSTYTAPTGYFPVAFYLVEGDGSESKKYGITHVNKMSTANKYKLLANMSYTGSWGAQVILASQKD